MTQRDEKAPAAVALAYGSPVRLVDGMLEPIRIKLDWQGRVVRDLYDHFDQMCGVLCRPATANANGVDILGCRARDMVTYRTDGHILAIDADGHSISIILRDGKPVE
jgi:hypothetical protein